MASILFLGGRFVYIDAASSSVKKGETLKDTIDTIVRTGQVNAIILRHPQNGAARTAARTSAIPIISAGDGSNEHPTQTLVDLYTIWEELGTIGGLRVTMVGDLHYGRTVHSLAKALALRENTRLHYVAPNVALQMPSEIMDYVSQHSVAQQTHCTLDDELLATTDVLYMTRMQTERFLPNDDGKGGKPTEENWIAINPATLAKVKDKMLVLHPLPRGPEISPEIDNDPRAAYMRQMSNGPYVRMALLCLMLA